MGQGFYDLSCLALLGVTKKTIGIKFNLCIITHCITCSSLMPIVL